MAKKRGRLRMKMTHLLYAAFFVTALVVFISIYNGEDGSLRKVDDEVLVSLITLFGSVLIYVDFRQRRSKAAISKAIAALWAVNATLAALLYLLGFNGPGALLVPVFMFEGALIYHWLENSSAAGRSQSAES